ncbi:MAG TPA: hypothetical protein PK228_17610, partial [Saprospiraceae bacterium]|nr:hypothetical protein [Saprospiraceae bacterium]
FSTLSVATGHLSGPPESPGSIAGAGDKLYGTFASSSAYFFMGGGGLMYSSDNGQTWIPDPNFAGKHVVHVGFFNSALYAVEYETAAQSNGSVLQTIRIHRSTDNGATYTVVKEITDDAYGNPPYGYFGEGIFRQVNGVLFLTYSDEYQNTTYLHSWYSTDGITWAKTTLDYLSLENFSNRENKISGSEGWFFYNFGWADYIYAAQNPDMSDGKFISFMDKDEFVEAYSIGGKFIAYSTRAIYTSTTWFDPWNFQISDGINNLGACILKDGYFHLFDQLGGFYRAPVDQPEIPQQVYYIPGEHYNTSYGETPDALYLLGHTPVRSFDNGLTWSSFNSNLAVTTFLHAHHNWLWTQQGFMFRSLDGVQWSMLQPQGLPHDLYDWKNMVEIQGRMFLRSGRYYDEKIYYSDDGGTTWALAFDHPSYFGYSKLIADATNTRLYCLYQKTPVTELFMSDDKGATWTQINDPDPPLGEFAAKGDTIFFVNNGQLVYTYDLGTTWNSTQINFAFPDPALKSKMFLTTDGQLLLVNPGKKSGHLSTDWGQHFTQTLQMPTYFDGTIKQDSLLAFSISYSYSNYDGIYLSNNNGISGVSVKDTAWRRIQGCVLKDGYLYGSTHYFGGVVRTDLQPIADALQYIDDFGTVEAKIFFDRNQNCVQDSGEESVAGHPMVFQPGDFIATSGSDGIVRRVLPSPQSYTAQLTPYPYTSLVNCQPLNNIAVTSGNVTSLTLGMKPQGVQDLALNLSASALRPGFDGRFTITVENKGVEPVAGGTLLQFTYPDNEVVFVDAIPAPVSTGAGIVGFVLPDIPLFSSFTIRINVTVPPDPDLTGQYVIVDAQLPPPYFDQTQWNHNITKAFRITNSYDPNDKTAFTNAPGGHQMRTSDKTIQYLIRFQNTGTDTAFSVVVADTLSPLLDWTTLKTVAASHPYRMTVDDPGVVRWRFDNILLPDSVTNEPASHGYILFNIDKKSTVVVGDTLKNSAAIYFDFNYPVITNRTETVVVKRLIYRETRGEEQMKIQLEIMPNPVGDHMIWKVTGLESGVLSAGIYDESGRLVQTILQNQFIGSESDWVFSENTEMLPAGVYRLSVVCGDKTLTAPFIRLE